MEPCQRDNLEHKATLGQIRREALEFVPTHGPSPVERRTQTVNESLVGMHASDRLCKPTRDGHVWLASFRTQELGVWREGKRSLGHDVETASIPIEPVASPRDVV